MWNEPMPKWRTARKQHQCQGDDCTKIIEPGDRYLDQSLRHPENSHLRYCNDCAEPVMASAKGYHFFRGRNDFPDRYHKRVSSAEWKNLRREIIEERGNQCERCGKEDANLELHHLHYRSLESEQPEDVELLCRECHEKADEARASQNRPKRHDPEEGLIVGPDGDTWGKFDPDTIYVPLENNRYVPIKPKRKP